MVIMQDQVVGYDCIHSVMRYHRPRGAFTMCHLHEFRPAHVLESFKSAIDGCHLRNSVFGEYDSSAVRQFRPIPLDFLGIVRDVFHRMCRTEIAIGLVNAPYDRPVLECIYVVCEQSGACGTQIIRITHVCELLKTDMGAPGIGEYVSGNIHPFQVAVFGDEFDEFPDIRHYFHIVEVGILFHDRFPTGIISLDRMLAELDLFPIECVGDRSDGVPVIFVATVGEMEHDTFSGGIRTAEYDLVDGHPRCTSLSMFLYLYLCVLWDSWFVASSSDNHI